MNLVYEFRIYILVVAIIVAMPLNNVFACSQYDGKTQKDERVAKKMCSVFKDIPDILMMSVNESILYVDVTRSFYDAMTIDKIRGTQLVKTWMKGLRNETGKKSVTVWVYTDKEKVIEGDTTLSGGDKVKFLY